MNCFVCGNKPVAAHRTGWAMTEVSGLTVHRGCQRELAHAFNAVDDLTDRAAPVLSWASNGNQPFDDLLELWEKLGYISAEQRAATNAARKASTDAFLAAYRADPPQRSAEDIAEMRAAFGPGETVVDVITGERFEL